MAEIMLINITGEDRPGLTHELSEILATHHVRVLDIGQAVIHQTLTWGILIALPEDSEADPVLKDVLFKAHALGLQARFSPVDSDAYESWVTEQGKPRHIITLLGPELAARSLERVSRIITRHGMNIDIMTRLSGRVSLEHAEQPRRACLELSVRGAPDDPHTLRADLLSVSHELGVDIAIQVDDVYRRNRRMVAFDMDSTLIQTEVIDELAEAAGVRDAVSAITEAAMNGELDFCESLTRRLRLLEGLPESVLAEIAESLPLTDGAERLIRTLKSLGYTTAILSGGFTYFGQFLQRKLGIDHVYANELEIREGRLTGKVTGPIVDGDRKAALLREIAEQEGIRLEQVIAVGDGANDLPMLEAAGLGIAFHAKPKVKEEAEQSISTLGLDGILYLIGVRDREVGGGGDSPC
jgi:phosphoserine phosphatase